MEECKKGQGCDRHLFGLLCIAEENELPIPKIFRHKAYTASGGNGNFILSTSTCGYTGKIIFIKVYRFARYIFIHCLQLNLMHLGKLI